jgi:outer membrane protein
MVIDRCRWGPITLGVRVALIVATTLTGTPWYPAVADTLEAALALAYQNNPQLNARRAATRAVDENVGIALSIDRPKLAATARAGPQYLDLLSIGTGGAGHRSVGTIGTTSYGLTASQMLFNGFQNASRTRQAEGQVSAARETLRATEQAVLLAAAVAYMNLLRDGAVTKLQRKNVNVLEATRRQTRDCFAIREVTLTDVAQAESSLAAGRSNLLAAESTYVTSKAAYVR